MKKYNTYEELEEDESKLEDLAKMVGLSDYLQSEIMEEFDKRAIINRFGKR